MDFNELHEVWKRNARACQYSWWLKNRKELWDSYSDRMRALIWNEKVMSWKNEYMSGEWNGRLFVAHGDRFSDGRHGAPDYRGIRHPVFYSGGMRDQYIERLKKLASELNEPSARMIHKIASEQLQKSIVDDGISRFDIELTLSGIKLTPSILFWTIINHSTNILCHLLRKYTKKVTSFVQPDELLLLLCLNKGNWTPALDTLEQLFPGISRSTVDAKGDTPLWFCLYRNDHQEFENALLRYGCNPDQRNHLNLSYNLCKTAMLAQTVDNQTNTTPYGQ